MGTYDLLIMYLLDYGPIVGVFRYCLDNGLNYPWTYKQARRAQERGHITITRSIDQRGRPDRLELTQRGALYARSIRPGGAL